MVPTIVDLAWVLSAGQLSRCAFRAPPGSENRYAIEQSGSDLSCGKVRALLLSAFTARRSIASGNVWCVIGGRAHSKTATEILARLSAPAEKAECGKYHTPRILGQRGLR